MWLQVLPAEMAGLQEGDVVMAINKIFNQNLTQLKSALQNANDKIKMIVRRNGELKMFEFKVRTIL